MFRKMMTVLAMAALMACAACNSVMGPAANDNGNTSGDRGGSGGGKGNEINPNVGQLEPPDNGGGSGGEVPEPIDTSHKRHAGGRGQISPVGDPQNVGQLEPPDNGGGSGGEVPEPIDTSHKRHSGGRGQISPVGSERP